MTPATSYFLSNKAYRILLTPLTYIPIGKAEGVPFSYSKLVTDNAVRQKNSRGPRQLLGSGVLRCSTTPHPYGYTGWAKKALFCVARHSFRMTKLLSSRLN